MRKIAFINTLTSRGAERQVSHLMAEGIFDLLILIDDICFYQIDPGKLKILLPGFFRLPMIKKLLFLPLVFIRLVRLLEKEDVVISFLEISNYLSLLAKPLSCHKAWVSVRTLPSHQYIVGIAGFFHRLLIRILYPLADKIITNSLGGKKDLEEEFCVAPGKTVSIPNGYPIEQILEQASQSIPFLKDKSKIDLLYVAGLVEGKGHEALIEIFHKLRAETQDLRLIFLGEGYLRKKLVSKSRQLGLKVEVTTECGGADVYFLGQVKNPYPWMRNSELFLFPSQWEGLPNALIEAGIVGANIVTADAPWGPREILNKSLDEPYSLENYPQYTKSGVLLPVLSTRSPTIEKAKMIWIKTLSSLIHDKGSREAMGKSASQEFLRYDLHNVILEWKSLLEKHF